MKPNTLAWLEIQSQKTDVDSEIREDLIAFLSVQKNGTATSMYLAHRTMPLDASGTSGKWDRKKQEQLFKSGVDNDFENWGAVDKKSHVTGNVKVLPYDLIKDGTYMQVIPDKPTYFFANASAALQVVYDNLALQQEVLEQDHRLHLPFVNENGDKFVARVFKDDGRLRVDVFGFSFGYVWNVEYGYVFIFPLQSAS